MKLKLVNLLLLNLNFDKVTFTDIIEEESIFTQQLICLSIWYFYNISF